MMLNYIDLYGQEGTKLAQNAKEQDQKWKTTRSASAKEIPLKNPKDEVRIKGKFGHMPSNIGIN